MTDLLQHLQDFYAKAEWPMVQVPDQPILTSSYQGTHGQWAFVVVPHEDLGVVTMFCRAPLDSSPDRYDDLTVFLERVNFGLTIGAWVLDREDGEIRFRIGMDASGGDLSNHLLRRFTMLCVTAMDSMVPTLQALIEEGLGAQEALERLISP